MAGAQAVHLALERACELLGTLVGVQILIE